LIVGLKYNMASILESTFDVTVIVVHVAYLALVFGLVEKQPDILETVDFWLKVFMAIFLILRFNPFTTIKFTEFDRKVVFATGVFLFTVTVVNNYLQTYVERVKKNLKRVFGTKEVKQ